MTTRRWPDTLPGASTPGFGLTPKDQSIRTDMEVGAKRVRRITKARLDTVSFSWVMTDPQMWAFRAWHGDEQVSLIGDSDSLAAWSPTNYSRSGLSKVGPDSVLVDKLTETAVTGGHYAQIAIPDGAFDNATMTCCVSLVGFNRSKARVSFFDRAGAECYVEVDLSADTITAAVGVSAPNLIDRGYGFSRVQFLVPTGAGGNIPVLRVSGLDDTGALSYLGDISKGLSVAEMQARISTGFDLFVPADSDGNATGAAGGSAWFLTYVAQGGGLTQVESRFTGPYMANALAALRWTITGQVEVRNA